MTTLSVADGCSTSTQVRSYSQCYHPPASAASAHHTALAVLQAAQASAAAAAVGTSDAHSEAADERPSNWSSARQHIGSCTGSIVSLSAGVPPATGVEGSHSSVCVPEYAAGGLAADNQTCADRCSCSSQVLSVDVAADALHFHSTGATGAALFDGHDSSCDTPTLGLASAAAVDRQRAAGLFRARPPPSSSPQAAAVQATELWERQLQGECVVQRPAAEAFSGTSSSNNTSSRSDDNTAAVQSAPTRVAKAAATAVQALTSYLDRDLGLRVQGLVAEVSRS